MKTLRCRVSAVGLIPAFRSPINRPRGRRRVMCYDPAAPSPRHYTPAARRTARAPHLDILRTATSVHARRSHLNPGLDRLNPTSQAILPSVVNSDSRKRGNLSLAAFRRRRLAPQMAASPTRYRQASSARALSAARQTRPVADKRLPVLVEIARDASSFIVRQSESWDEHFIAEPSRIQPPRSRVVVARIDGRSYLPLEH